MMKKTVGMLAAAMLVVPAIASAQAAGEWGFGVAATYSSLTGDIGTNLNAGPGADALISYGMSKQFSLGGGASYQSFGVSGGGSGNVHLLGVFADPRWSFSAMSPKMTPYIGGRLGWLQGSYSGGGGNANGYSAGAGLGLLYAMGTGANFDVSARYDYLHLSKNSVSTNGGGFGIRAGFNWMMGK